MIKIDENSLQFTDSIDISNLGFTDSIRKSAKGSVIPLLVNHKTSTVIGNITIDSCNSKYLKVTGELCSPRDIYNLQLQNDLLIGYTDDEIVELSIRLKEGSLNGHE